MYSWVSRQIARVVAVLSLGVLSPGCLIPAPDELEEPERIPPRALVGSAIPVVTEIVQTWSTGDPKQFNVRYVSDDLGDLVIARLFLNYPDKGAPLGYAPGPASTSESGNDMVIFWDDRRNVPAGCYTVTLAISQADNFSRKDYKPIDPDKTAFVTWWVAHDIEPQLVNLDECSPSGTIPE